jgi:hypothetical protein
MIKKKLKAEEMPLLKLIFKQLKRFYLIFMPHEHIDFSNSWQFLSKGFDHLLDDSKFYVNRLLAKKAFLTNQFIMLLIKNFSIIL